MTLQRLNFGYEDAERDIAGGLLRASFIRTVAYDATVSGRKMLIIGRKGSGKSAICMQLAASGTQRIVLTPDDAVGTEIRRFMRLIRYWSRWRKHKPPMDWCGLLVMELELVRLSELLDSRMITGIIRRLLKVPRS